MAQVRDQGTVPLDLSTAAELPESVAKAGATQVQKDEGSHDPDTDRRRHPERLHPPVPQESERLSVTVLESEYTREGKNDQQC